MNSSELIKTAFILAGGFGTRLSPWTYLNPKPLLTVYNKPLIMWHIEKLIKFNVRNFIVNIHHCRYKMKSFLEYHFELLKRETYDLSLTILEEEQILGTGGALFEAKSFIKETNFFLINSDVIHKFDYEKISKFHQDHSPIATMVLKKTSDPVLRQIAMNKKHQIVQIGDFALREHKEPLDYLFTGIHVLNRRIFNYCTEKKFSCIIRDIYKNAVLSKESLFGFETKNYWIDMGTPEKYEILHRNIRDKVIEI